MDADLPKTSKGLVKREEKESYELEDIPIPELTRDDVLIRVDASAICGSDIGLFKWNEIARVIATLPFTPGHECAGTVVKCGPDANIALGSKVGVENHYFCGDCFQCHDDTREICTNMGQFGHGRKTIHGSCSEYTVVPEKYLFKVTRDLTPDQIAMMEPLGVSHNAVERLLVSGENVLILGCGPIGLLAIACAKAMGCKEIIAADVEQGRLEIAKKMGADFIVNCKEDDLPNYVMEYTDGVGIGRICECSGAPPMVNRCFSWLRKGGRIVLIGLPKEPIHIENPLPNVVFKTLTLKTVHGRRIFHTWKEVENLLADKKVDVNPIISHRYNLSEYEDAFQTLMSGACIKIILYPGGREAQ